MEKIFIVKNKLDYSIQSAYMYANPLLIVYRSLQGELNARRGQQGFRTLCCDVFGLLENSQFLRNNNNKGSRSNVNKHELVYGESSSNARDAPNVCLSFVLLFTIFIIVLTQKLALQQTKNVTAKCTETLFTPPSIQFSLGGSSLIFKFKSVYIGY